MHVQLEKQLPKLNRDEIAWHDKGPTTVRTSVRMHV